MGKVTNKVPQLRFPGFDAEWEEKKIKEILSIGSGKDYKNLEKGDIPVYGTGGYMTSVNDFLYDGESVCIGRKGTIDKPQYLKGKFWTVDTLFFTHSLKDVLPPFIFLLFQNINWLKYNEASGVPSLSKSTIENIEVIISSIPEQKKIATFFTEIDKRITLLSQQKEKLEQYKKGVMQKIFSRQLRFKDENGKDFPEWEEKRLGDISDVKRGASPRPISSPKWFSENSSIGWVRISDVTSSYKYLTKTTQYLSDEGVKKSRKIKIGSIIMSICATIGKPIYTMFEVCIHDGFIVFDNLNINKEYLFYYLQYIQERWYMYGQPGTQVNLNSDIVSNEFIQLPILESEQQKIAAFLSAIDKKIEITNQQVTAMKTWKQGLLQKMFV